MREKALEIRHKAQVHIMKNMLDNRTVSPTTF